MTDAKPVPDAPGATPPATIAALHDRVVDALNMVSVNWQGPGRLSEQELCGLLSDVLDTATAEVVRLTQERDRTYKHLVQEGPWPSGQADTASENERLAQLLRLECLVKGTGWELTEARLTAQAAALWELEQEIRAAQRSAYEVAGPKSPRGHDYKRWADRLAALRTP